MFKKTNIVFLLLSISCFASDIPESFHNFVEYQLKRNGTNSALLYVDPSVKVDTSQEAQTHNVRFTMRGITVTLSPTWGASDELLLGYHLESSSTKLSDGIEGDRFFLSWNGTIYSESYDFTSYIHYKKWQLTPEGYREITQPFQYVGETCKTNERLQLYSEKCSEGSVIATVPAGSEMTVLLEDINNPSKGCNRRNYLIKNAFGLVGWGSFSLQNSMYDSIPTVIDCLKEFAP